MHRWIITAIAFTCFALAPTVTAQGELLPLKHPVAKHSVVQPTERSPVQPVQDTIQTPHIPDEVLHPGIVAFRDGKWLWSDHLLNLSNNIDVSVELASTESVKSKVDTAKIKTEVEDIFKKAGITPYALPDPGKPNLPSFQILILAYPVKDGYMFALIARLFEPVQLERIKLDERVTMQAITWERSSIQVVQESNFEKEVNAAAVEVAKQFAERFEFFEKLRQENQ